MPSTREIRRRIKSVKSTKQITKAMELVSASKMRRASEAALGSRPYADRLNDLVHVLLGGSEEGLEHPFLTQPNSKVIVVVAIASDRTLAGAYNTSVARQATQFYKEQTAAGYEVKFITWGRTLTGIIARLGYPILQSYEHGNVRPTSESVLPIIESLGKSFLAGELCKVEVIYTRFVSLLRQEVQSEQLLPIQLSPAQPSSQAIEFTIEPSSDRVLEALFPRLIETQLYHALLESLASEHSARRMAMKSATDNAGDMIDDLTLTYNGLRQSAITRELAEITGGAASLS